MSGRIRAKVLETGRESKINSPKPLKRPLEYIVTEKWDALAQDKKLNVDASKSDERGSGVSGKVEYSRALSDFGSLKMKPAMSYDSGYESSSLMSHASSSFFSGPETGALNRFEEKVLLLCEHMTCTKIDDSSDDNDDSHVQKRRRGLHTRTAKKKYGIEASKSHDFSLDSFDSDIVEDISSADSIDEDTLEEDTLAKDELDVKECSKEVIEAPVLKIRAEDSLEKSKLDVKEPPRKPPVRFEGKKHLKASTMLTDDTSVVDKETLNLEETGTIPELSPNSALNPMETISEKVEEDNEEVKEFPCIEYTLSSHEKVAESNELDSIEVDVIEFDMFHFKAPLKEAAISASPGCDDSILERTFSLTETEDSLPDGIHVSDDMLSVTLGSIGSLTSGMVSNNDDVFDAPVFEYTLSTLNKHEFDADAVAATVEEESSKTTKVAALVSVDSIPEHDDEDAVELPSIEYTLTDGESMEETSSSADKDYSPIAGKRETDANQACKTTGSKYRRYLWRRFNRPSATAAAKSVQRSTKATDDKSAVTQVTKNDVPFTGSKMTDDKNAKETGSIADKEPSPNSMLLEHVASESSVLAYAEEVCEMDLIPGKSETDANQASTNRDAPIVIDQAEPHNVFPDDATVGDSCETIGRERRRPRWRRSKRSSAVAAAKSTERTTKSTDDKSATEPPVDEGAFSLDEGSAEKQKSADLVAPEQALATFELLHVMNLPMSVTDAILGKTETDTDKASTNKDASNESEPNSETSAPRQGFIHRARSRSRSVTRGLMANRRSLTFGRQSRSETETDQTSKNKDASNGPGPNSETSDPHKGFIHRARSRSRSGTRGPKADRRSLTFGRQSGSETDTETSTNKDASNEPEPNSETSEPHKGFIHRARSRSRSMTRGLMADRRSRSAANRERTSASSSNQKMDNRRFPWFSPRIVQTTDAGEDQAVPNMPRRTKITMRQKERKEYAYKEMEDDKTVDNLVQCYNCSCLPE